MEHASHLLDYRSAAERLGVPLGSLYSLVHHRRIPHVRLGPRFVRFEPAALDAWVAAGRIAPSVTEAAVT